MDNILLFRMQSDNIFDHGKQRRRKTRRESTFEFPSKEASSLTCKWLFRVVPTEGQFYRPKRESRIGSLFLLQFKVMEAIIQHGYYRTLERLTLFIIVNEGREMYAQTGYAYLSYLFLMLSSLTPLIGAVLADNKFGVLVMILAFGLLVFLIGVVILIVIKLNIKSVFIFPVYAWLLVSGCYHACFDKLIGDQVYDSTFAQTDKLFSIYVLVIKIGQKIGIMVYFYLGRRCGFFRTTSEKSVGCYMRLIGILVPVSFGAYVLLNITQGAVICRLPEKGAVSRLCHYVFGQVCKKTNTEEDVDASSGYNRYNAKRLWTIFYLLLPLIIYWGILDHEYWFSANQSVLMHSNFSFLFLNQIFSAVFSFVYVIFILLNIFMLPIYSKLSEDKTVVFTARIIIGFVLAGFSLIFSMVLQTAISQSITVAELSPGLSTVNFINIGKCRLNFTSRIFQFNINPGQSKSIEVSFAKNMNINIHSVCGSTVISKNVNIFLKGVSTHTVFVSTILLNGTLFNASFGNYLTTKFDILQTPFLLENSSIHGKKVTLSIKGIAVLPFSAHYVYHHPSDAVQNDSITISGSIIKFTLSPDIAHNGMIFIKKKDTKLLTVEGNSTGYSIIQSYYKFFPPGDYELVYKQNKQTMHKFSFSAYKGEVKTVGLWDSVAPKLFVNYEIRLPLVNVMWQLPQLAFSAMSKILIMISTLSLTYCTAPESLRTCGISLIYVFMFFGHLFSKVLWIIEMAIGESILLVNIFLMVIACNLTMLALFYYTKNRPTWKLKRKELRTRRADTESGTSYWTDSTSPVSADSETSDRVYQR